MKKSTTIGKSGNQVRVGLTSNSLLSSDRERKRISAGPREEKKGSTPLQHQHQKQAKSKPKPRSSSKPLKTKWRTANEMIAGGEIKNGVLEKQNRKNKLNFGKQSEGRQITSAGLLKSSKNVSSKGDSSTLEEIDDKPKRRKRGEMVEKLKGEKGICGRSRYRQLTTWKGEEVVMCEFGDGGGCEWDLQKAW
ncbi:hypothetical protein Ancab_016236 [Ancistrocladus abbreviatus]